MDPEDIAMSTDRLLLLPVTVVTGTVSTHTVSGADPLAGATVVVPMVTSLVTRTKSEAATPLTAELKVAVIVNGSVSQMAQDVNTGWGGR